MKQRKDKKWSKKSDQKGKCVQQISTDIKVAIILVIKSVACTWTSATEWLTVFSPQKLSQGDLLL